MIDPNSLMEMLESSFDGIWITDGEGNILFANSANATLIGMKKEDIEGRSTQDLLKDHIFSDSVILDALQQKKRISKVSKNFLTNLTVLATATPILGNSGEVKYVFNNVRDITALNQLQSDLQGKDEIIRQQSQQLESMKIRLGESTIVANSSSFSSVV